ncbi:MAG: response regulator [Planctomycetota bacterium]|nr:response regulator [Planctomycetota bacterium]
MVDRRLLDQTVLIVDDDEDILGSMELAIRAEGAKTLTASDGNEAIARWRAESPDMVVLDMMLPKRSGFLVLEELMQDETPPLVVMVTANEGRRHMIYAERLGVHAYLTKPIPLQQLIDTLCELQSQRASDEGSTISGSD